MTDRRPLILMVEDDADTARLNARMLRRRGYEALVAAGAAEARALARSHAPDLFVLDIELPDGDGFSLCEEIRRHSDAPVLFLTGRKATVDKVAGMNTGGDYYLTKPYYMDELMAVIARLLKKAEETRRRLDQAVLEATELTRGSLTLCLPDGRAMVNGRDAGLTPKEFAVLLVLARNAGKPLTAGEIYSAVWSAGAVRDTGALRAHIAHIKQKIGTGHTDEYDIVYVRGKGYSFITT